VRPNHHAGCGEGVTVLLAIGVTYSTLFRAIPDALFGNMLPNSASSAIIIHFHLDINNLIKRVGIP